MDQETTNQVVTNPAPVQAAPAAEAKPAKDPTVQLLRSSRMHTLLLLLILVIVVAAGAYVCLTCIQVQNTVKQLDMQQLNNSIAAVEKVAEKVSEIDAESVSHALDGIGTMTEKFKGFDLTQLNQLVTSLENITTKLESTTKLFSMFFGGGK